MLPEGPRLAPRCHALSCGGDRVTVAAENKGGKAVLLGNPELHIAQDGIEQPTNIALVAERGDPNVLVKPNEVVAILYRAHLRDESVTFPTGPRCELRIRIPSFDGGEVRIQGRDGR